MENENKTIKTKDHRNFWRIVFQKRVFKIIGLLIIVVVIFLSGMIFELFRASNPATKPNVQSAQEKVAALRAAAARKTVTGNITQIEKDSISIKDDAGNILYIKTSDHIMILSTSDKPIKKADLKIDQKVIITYTVSDENINQAVRIKIPTN